jgi:AcrR family transcriptional regulator
MLAEWGRDVPRDWAPLTHARICAAALELIDREGLRAVTMEALGERLGVTGMALYNYFPSKSALLGAVLDAALSSVPAAPTQGEWRGRLRAYYRGLWELFRAHPNALPLVASQSLRSPLIGACAQAGQGVLVESGFDAEQVRPALLTLTAYALGFAGLTAGGYLEAAAAQTGDAADAAAAAPAPIDWAAAEREYLAGLEVVLDAVARRLA